MSALKSHSHLLTIMKSDTSESEPLWELSLDIHCTLNITRSKSRVEDYIYQDLHMKMY